MVWACLIDIHSGGRHVGLAGRLGGARRCRGRLSLVGRREGATVAAVSVRLVVNMVNVEDILIWVVEVVAVRISNYGHNIESVKARCTKIEKETQDEKGAF